MKIILVIVCSMLYSISALAGEVIVGNKSGQFLVIKNLKKEKIKKVEAKLLKIKSMNRNELSKRRLVAVEVLNELGQLHVLDKMDVDYVEENAIVSLNLPETEETVTSKASDFNDPLVDRQWGLDAIQLPQAHDRLSGVLGQGINIATIDTGANVTANGMFAKHPDIDSCIYDEYDFVNKDNFANDDNGHGNHVLSTLAETIDNAVGAAGVAPDACYAVYKVLGRDGSGTLSQVASGITRAYEKGADIISMSLGTSTSSITLENAVKAAQDSGAIVIASAGNDGNTRMQYPAAIENVISVIATNRNSQKAYFSTYGDWTTISAPGEDIVQYSFPLGSGCYSADCYGSVGLSGTSMAQPYVAAAVATWMSYAKQRGKNLLLPEIMDIISNSSLDLGEAGKDPLYGYGLLQIDSGLAYLDNGSDDMNQAPMVEILTPTEGSLVSGLFNVTANISDDVAIARIDYKINGSIIAQQSSYAALSIDSTQYADGDYQLSVTAFDNEDASTTKMVTFAIKNSNDTDPPEPPEPQDTEVPMVMITAPVDGSVVAKGSTISIEAQATDNVAVKEVRFFVGGNLQCVDTQAPYSCSWRVPKGKARTFVLDAQAIDTSGNADSHRITVQSSSGGPGGKKGRNK